MGSSVLINHLWGRQKGRCFYCDVPLYRMRHAGLGWKKFERMATLDHVLPKSAGGGRQHNLVWSCVDCNIRKGAELPTKETILRFAKLTRSL